MKLSDIKYIDFPQMNARESSLVIYESGTYVPFPTQRVFTIKTSEKCTRGFHAHKQCAQLLVCLHGHCVVTIDDGITRKDHILDQPNKGLLIPPTIWAEQAYEADTILMVLTDRLYEENDYIRNYEDFLHFRKAS